MLTPQRNHQGIYIRNFLSLFVVISFLGYIHFQIAQVTQSVEQTNNIINSLLRNQSYSIQISKFNKLYQQLNQKNYLELSQSQCLLKIYLDTLKNQLFSKQNQQSVTSGGVNQLNTINLTNSINYPGQSFWTTITGHYQLLNLNQLVFPDLSHDLLNFKNCSDVITLVNFLNPNKIDFIYTNFMQTKYGSFEHEQNQNQISSQKISNHNFCLLVNQFNNSLKTLRSNLNSLIDQTYENYELIVLDNGSDDGSYEIAKVILQDFKEKLIKEKPQDKAALQKKYQVIKEPLHMRESDLYLKHQKACEGSDYIIFIDGRDQLISRHVLSIINNKILKQQTKPQLLVGSILKRKQLNRERPSQFNSAQMQKSFPVFTFKVISTSLLNQAKQQMAAKIDQFVHPYQIHDKMTQILYELAAKKSSKVIEIDDMLYLYDSLQNKQIDRNSYFVSTVKKDIQKLEKSKKK